MAPFTGLARLPSTLKGESLLCGADSRRVGTLTKDPQRDEYC